ncbi:MAG TPA: hypothetical protein VGG75_13685 [Trebonia sp.]|jgi:hypothetical protein
MTHTWKSGGSHGKWVLHSAGGSGSDSIGVGLAEDMLGPFSSQKLAGTVADALANAYEAGLKDGQVTETDMSDMRTWTVTRTAEYTVQIEAETREDAYEEAQELTDPDEFDMVDWQQPSVEEG